MSKETLMQTATQTEYYDLDFEQLESLWTMSNDFIENGRLQALENEWYLLVEQHFFLSLLTCRDQVAKLMLQRIIDQYGGSSRRVIKLRTAYVRATQDSETFNQHVQNLADFENDSFKISYVDLKSKGKWPAYIQKLVEYLDSHNPIDAEAWSELAEAYITIGNYEEAIKCLEQVLLIVPFAYNIFARIGEIRHLQAGTLKGGMATSMAQMLDGCSHMCRGVELCPTFLRGWCGLYILALKINQLGNGKYPEHQQLAEKARSQIAKALEEDGKTRRYRPKEVEAARKILLA